MTTIGQAITVLYSLIVITTLIVMDLKEFSKNENAGWIAICLTPVFILLVNII